MSLLIDKPGPLLRCCACGAPTWRALDYWDVEGDGWCEWCIRFESNLGDYPGNRDRDAFAERPDPPDQGQEQAMLPFLLVVRGTGQGQPEEPVEPERREAQ